MATPEGQGSDAIDPMGSRPMSSSSRGRSGINVDTSQLKSLENALDSAGRAVDRFKQKWSSMSSGMRGSFGGGVGGGGGSRINMPMAGSEGSPASSSTGGLLSRFGFGGGGGGGVPGGGGIPGVGSLTSALGGKMAPGISMGVQALSAANDAMNQRIAQGADYSLQADRMSVQLQQMYGMSNAQVRNQLRMPLTTHYLLGGGTAINDLLAMQANTGLTATKQASTVEAFRTISGFSLGAKDVTSMLSTMASPDVANRMFMMGGTGMYGIGGKERTGMQTIQDIVRRTGLTNPEALKGALQQGSNTRQRLTAMGVPQDMQDMVIQYAMQNAEYQKKTGGGAMYDPSLEENRKTTGIEGSYAVQHEKTTGERIKREEKFYGRQVDNFAQFEKNLRSATKALAALDETLSSAYGLKISTKGHPVTNAVSSIAKTGLSLFDGDAVDTVKGSFRSGDSIDGLNNAPTPSNSESTKLPADTEKKLATLKPELAVPLRRMLEERPDIKLHDTIRSREQQERSFRERYRPTTKTQKTDDTDREWNNVIWEMKESARRAGAAALAPPGQSNHEIGLAADINQEINPEHKQWILSNASRFGLQTGATGRGGPGDEWFHIEPAGTTGRRNNKKSSTGSSSSTRIRAYARPVKTQNATRGQSGTMSPDAGAIAAQMVQESAKKYNSARFGPSYLVGSSVGGDSVDGMDSYGGGGGVGGGGAMSITISPNIYLNGGQDSHGDMRRIAQEVGKLLEDEVKLRMMRRL